MKSTPGPDRQFVFSLTMICGACMGVEVGSTVADGVAVSMLVGEGDIGVTVTETSIGSGKAVSVDNNP